MVAKVRQFAQEVQLEMKKVTWPSREELRGSTMVVIVMVILVSIFIGVVDRILSFGLERFLS
jgi:preprotein translocase subunit SecE